MYSKPLYFGFKLIVTCNSAVHVCVRSHLKYDSIIEILKKQYVFLFLIFSPSQTAATADILYVTVTYSHPPRVD